MREPAEPAAFEDVGVRRKLHERPPPETQRVAAEGSPWEEGFPSTTPVHARRRPMQPHGVAVADSEHGKERCEGVADECRIELLQIARSNDDGGGERRGDENSPRACPHALERLPRRDWQRARPFDVARPEHSLIRHSQHQRGAGKEHESGPDCTELIPEHA